MEYGHHEMNKQAFKRKICGFRRMNTLLQIKHSGHLYCCCHLNQRKCQICLTTTDFCGFENELNRNMMNVGFFKNYQMKLYPYLTKLFYDNKPSICCFFDSEYSYSIQHQSGKVTYVFLSDMIKQAEEDILNKIKKKIYEPFTCLF